MKSIKSHTKSKRFWKIILPVMVAVLLLAGSAFAYLSTRDTSDPTVRPAPEKLSEEDAKDKENFINDNSDSIKGGSDNNGREGVIESSSIAVDASQSSNEIIVSTKLYDISSGTCRLSIKNGVSSIEREAEIIYQDEYSTCAGFTITKSSLGPGSWNISLRVQSGTNYKSGTTALEVD